MSGFGWPIGETDQELVRSIFVWINDGSVDDETLVQNILNWVIEHYDPQELYGADKLKKWAESHDYVHEDDLAVERHRWV